MSFGHLADITVRYQLRASVRLSQPCVFLFWLHLFASNQKLYETPADCSSQSWRACGRNFSHNADESSCPVIRSSLSGSTYVLTAGLMLVVSNGSDAPLRSASSSGSLARAIFGRRRPAGGSTPRDAVRNR